MEQNSQCYNEKLYAQIEDAYGKLLYTYTTHIIQASRVKKRSQQFKWAQIILSAISTGGFIGTIVSNEAILIWVGGLCSTALLVLTSYLKDVDLSSTVTKHLDTSNQLWTVRERYISLLTDFCSIPTEEAKMRRDNLQTETAAIYKEAPITDTKSYALAQQALKEKESQYFTREELNKMLPGSLRK